MIARFIRILQSSVITKLFIANRFKCRKIFLFFIGWICRRWSFHLSDWAIASVTQLALYGAFDAPRWPPCPIQYKGRHSALYTFALGSLSLSLSHTHTLSLSRFRFCTRLCVSALISASLYLSPRLLAAAAHSSLRSRPLAASRGRTSS